MEFLLIIIITIMSFLWLLDQNHYIPIKVARQNLEVSTGIKIETRRNPSKPVETCHRNPSKSIKTHQNLSKLKGFDFCQNGIRVLPRNFNPYFLLHFFDNIWTNKGFQVKTEGRANKNPYHSECFAKINLQM